MNRPILWGGLRRARCSPGSRRQKRGWATPPAHTSPPAESGPGGGVGSVVESVPYPVDPGPRGRAGFRRGNRRRRGRVEQEARAKGPDVLTGVLAERRVAAVALGAVLALGDVVDRPVGLDV